MKKLDIHMLSSRVSLALAAFGAIATLIIFTGSGVVSAASSPTLARCYSGWLTVSLGRSNGAAGSIYYPLKFKNISGSTCTLYGYPGVSALRNGHQLGNAAVWTANVPKHTVVLTPGATASTVLQVVDVWNFPPNQCLPESATQLKVYPPGAYDSHVIPMALTGCASTIIDYLFVKAIQ